MIDHDVKPGPLRRCQISGSAELELVIDLGHQAPCDALLTAEQLDRPEITYPLRLMLCAQSGLAQLDYIVAGEEIYPPSYPYKAGLSWPVVQAHGQMAAELVERFGKGAYVDIGSNDGTLLKALQALGCTVLGVEPTDVAQGANADGVFTVQAFFDEALGRELTRELGRARVITMTNVFAHMANLGSVMRGVKHLLARDGVLAIENHYLLDVLERNQFDTIYHEHLRTYSLKALVQLFAQYGMEVFDAVRVPRYGGNIRVFACNVGARPVEASVGALLRLEEERGLHRPDAWIAFRARVYEQRDRFMDELYRLKREGRSIAGNSCPGRCATLINFYGIGRDLIPYLGELPGSLKLGKYLPGRHIPVVSNRRIVEDQPDNLVLMAWHYAAEIMQRLRAEGVRSRFLLPLPTFSAYSLD